jgi:hypothetical protein
MPFISENGTEYGCYNNSSKNELFPVRGVQLIFDTQFHLASIAAFFLLRFVLHKGLNNLVCILQLFQHESTEVYHDFKL